MIEALRSTHGATVAVPEDGIMNAFDKLASQGILAEPTSAAAAAALDDLLDRRLILAGDTTVVVVTGTGIKSATAIADYMAK